MTASLNDAVTKIADRTGAVATAVKPIPPRSRPLAVRRQPFGASEAPSRDGRSGRCSRPGASPDNPGDRARPPRTRRPAGPRSPLCHPTAPRHPHRRSYPRRRASAPRRHNRCPTGRRAHDHCPGGSASSDRGSGRRIPGCSGSSSLSGRRQSRSLGMRAVITIRGVRNIAARVTHTGRDDAGPLADQILHAPETSSCENSALMHVKPPLLDRDIHRIPRTPSRRAG